MLVREFDEVVKQIDEECNHLYYGRIYSFYPNERIVGDFITEQYDRDFKMAKLCEKALFALDEMERKVKGTNLSAADRKKYLERIDVIRMTPYYILAFYRDYLYGKNNGFTTSYFKDGKEGFEESAKRFFDLCDKCCVYELGEAKKIEWHKQILKFEE